MPVSLQDILNKPELEKSVSIDWVRAELVKQPYNQYLQGLLSRKTDDITASPPHSIKFFIEKIISTEKAQASSSYYIRDVELDIEQTFAEAKETEIEGAESTFAEAREAEIKEQKKNQITSAAIGAGAILTGSIVSGAKEAADQPEMLNEDPITQTDQIEESGLLGFLNRLEGSVKRSTPNAAVDPMHKEENYVKKDSQELGAESKDVSIEYPEQHIEDKGQKAKVSGQIADGESDSRNKKNKGEVKKKKKVKEKANKGLRWSSMTPSDYKIKNLDPFTVWVNSIDGVELERTEERKKGKKGKKKKKKGMHLDSLEDKPEIASEQLADLLVNQGHIQQAITMYERLSLKYPEKSSFFAGKIDTIKDKL